MAKIDGKALRIVIGKNISAIRNHQGETQTETAKALNIDPSVISRIQKGTYDSLTVEQLVELCNHFQVSLQQVIGAERTSALRRLQYQREISLTVLRDTIGAGYLLYIKDLKEELRKYKMKAKEMDDQIRT